MNAGRTCLAVLVVFAGVCEAETITVTTADGNGADAEVRGYSPDDRTDINYASSGTISARWGENRQQKIWLRFDLPDDIDMVTDARLELFYLRSDTELSIEVFGLTESADYGINQLTGEDRLGEDWPENLIAWNNAPGNVDSGFDHGLNTLYVEKLYRHYLPPPAHTTVTPPGTPTDSLVAFLNSDTNGMVTFIAGRPKVWPVVVNIASKEHTDPTSHAPRLVLEYKPIPEPSTFTLLAMGAFGLLAYAWRRRRTI